jgi:hypothetical protein
MKIMTNIKRITISLLLGVKATEVIKIYNLLCNDYNEFVFFIGLDIDKEEKEEMDLVVDYIKMLNRGKEEAATHSVAFFTPQHLKNA